MKSRRVSISLLIVLLLACVGGAAAQDTPILGSVVIVRSNVYMTPVGGTEARLGGPTQFEPGEVMRTDETGAALITWFFDGTESVVGPNTTVTLNNFSGGVAADFVLDVELKSGRLVSGVGKVAGANEAGHWTLTTPAFTVRLVQGQFDAFVSEDGVSTVVVTQGAAELLSDDADPVMVETNYAITAGPDDDPAVNTLSEDGVTVSLEGACTGVAETNVHVWLAPSENSRRLGTVSEGQVFWVRSGTEGNLWLQVHYQTAPDDEEGHNYGWVYGPAVTLDEEACQGMIMSPLGAFLYGGRGS